MTKTNFKMKAWAAVVALFAASMMMVVSCGGGNSKKQGSTAETPESAEQVAPAPSKDLKAEDVTVNNWQEFIKAQKGGLDISLPDGWTVTEVKPDGFKIIVGLNIGGSTTFEQFGQLLMNATKSIAKGGNHKLEVTSKGMEQGAAVETIGEVFSLGDVYQWGWTVEKLYHGTPTDTMYWLTYYAGSDDKKKAFLQI